MSDSTYLNRQQAAMLIENGAGKSVPDGGVAEYGMNHQLAFDTAALKGEGFVVVRFMKHCCLHYAVCSADALARVTGRTAAAAGRGVR